MSKYGKPEIYSRFLRKDWIKDNNKRIHLKAFIPNLNIETNRLEVSCFETQTLSEDDIYKIALENTISPNNKPPAGYCSIKEEEFLFNKVSIDKNYLTDRHVDIIGWEFYNSKEDRNEIASKLAEISSDNIIIYE